jgi:hypothetical protein
MNLTLVVFAVFAIAVMVIGIIEWLKAGWPKMPGWLPWVLSPVGCIGFALVAGPLVSLNGWWFAVLGFLALAITEICYQTIVMGLKNLVAAAAQAAQDKVSPPKA